MFDNQFGVRVAVMHLDNLGVQPQWLFSVVAAPAMVGQSRWGADQNQRQHEYPEHDAVSVWARNTETIGALSNNDLLRRCPVAGPSIHHAEAQHADQLSGFGHNLHLPVALRLRREVALVGPSPVARLASALDVQRDPVHLLAIVPPDMLNAFGQPARRVDRGVGVQAISLQLGGAELAQALAWRTFLHLLADGDFS